MHSRALFRIPAVLCVTSLLGCSVQTGPAEGTDTSAEAITACPVPGATDAQQRAAATLAFRLMRLSAAQVTTTTSSSSCKLPCLPRDILQAASIMAPQRYRIRSGGSGIEFDPTDPLYGYVSKQMQAELAFAQEDPSVAKFLTDGMTNSYTYEDGHLFPLVLASPALAKFSLKGTVTSHVVDSSSADDSHYATLTSAAWCGAVAVTLSETVDRTSTFSPIQFHDISMWRTSVPSYYKGKGHEVTTPFNGFSDWNPYLIVSVNGKAQQFDQVPTADCFSNPGSKCTSTIQIDPIPYAEPGDDYNNTGLVGTQSNPYPLSNTVLYADPAHATQWATRTANGTQEWGVFKTPVVLFGTTKYRYVKMM